MWFRRKIKGEKDQFSFTWHDCVNCPNFPSKDGSFEEIEISAEDHKDFLAGIKNLPNGGALCQMCKKKRDGGHCRILTRKEETTQ